jgi:DNA recombination protein RmuC
MSVLDLVLLGVAVSALGLVVGLVARGRRVAPPDSMLRSLADLGGMRAQVDALTAQQVGLTQTLGGLQTALQGVETRIVQSSAGVQETLGRQLQEARVGVERLKADAQARQHLDEELQASSRRIETVLLGSRTRGAAGENILHDAFKQFPADMIDMNFRVNGKVVEYALVLANGKRLPIDSKWPLPELLERLTEPVDPTTNPSAIEEEVERVIKAKVREVRQYVDPSVTLPWAIAAVPDPIFAACRKAHIEAHREGVVLMPYSMAVPFVLALFRLHLQNSRTVDIENLEGYLQQIEDSINALDRSLENSIARGSTMIQNAFTDCKRTLGQMRGAVAALRSVPDAGLPPGDEPASQPDLLALHADVSGNGADRSRLSA